MEGKMTLKAKLIATIASVCLVVGIIITSVWAVSVGTITIGGTVSFQAVDIFCDVSGQIENSANAQTFETLSWSAGNKPSDEQIASWKGRSLEFNESAEPITFTITITNKSQERFISVTLKDKTKSASNKIEKSVTFDGEDFDTDAQQPTIVKVDAGQTKSFVITFTFVGSHDETVKDVPYLYELSLIDENFNSGNN